ncbi:NAD(P)H-dependent oxidoreductase [Elizabethkingia sp. JS20170427COW]|uniref:NAD(P)H-dependent oxidoreductase n=1 Tax=Elizabethkingia sp. JS20170427COW TaxID=2583851 RepID=UPI001110C1D6|nr:NAD(P)H-dependent oxidoreductase [Elizabethkingia sp. JS20170427COW]QCX52969.1 NAD(P)H-dependent oxidoreductase [Elizabethkingia sp. JS20170427COW]
MDYLEALRWRYSVKKFNGKKIADKTIENILESARLSASSLGLQPYKIILIESDEVLAKIIPSFYNPNQISTCSHVIVLATETQLNDEYVDGYFQSICECRNMNLDQLGPFRKSIDGFIEQMSKEKKQTWAEKQAYIALGNLLFACALEEVDSCPMEGFRKEMLDQLLNLPEQNLTATVLLTLGYRSKDDEFQHLQKVRRSTEKFYLKY